MSYITFNSTKSELVFPTPALVEGVSIQVSLFTYNPYAPVYLSNESIENRTGSRGDMLYIKSINVKYDLV